MATLNVMDYGAARDGQTDDKAAIQAALDDASNGDTVYLPGGQDDYLISHSGRAGVDLAGTDVSADNLTVKGDPEETVLRLDETGQNPAPMGARNIENANWSTIEIRGIIFDGDKASNTDGHAFKLYGDAAADGLSITVFNCMFRDAVRAGYGESFEGVGQTTVRYCTAKNNDSHGFNPQGITGNADVDNPDTRIFNIRSIDNDGAGIDFHGGAHDCSSVYVENAGSHGMKAGAAGGKTEALRVTGATIKNSTLYGWTQTSDGSFSHDGTFYFDNFYVDGAGEGGIRADEGVTMNLTDTMVERAGNTSSGNSHNVMTDDSAVIDAGTLITQNATEGDGVFHASTATSSIDSLYYYDIPGSVTDVFNGTLNVGDQIQQEKAPLGTPSKGSVGAFTAAATTSSDDSGSPSPTTQNRRENTGSEDRNLRGNTILPRFIGTFLDPVDIATLDTVYIPTTEPEAPDYGAVLFYDGQQDELRVKKADGSVLSVA